MLEFFYILNATLLILHEIESGYEKEWEILKLPGKLTGFLLLHIPQARTVISVLAGSVGFVPFLVHKVIVNKKEHFNKTISNILIYGNIVTGVILIITGILTK